MRKKAKKKCDLAEKALKSTKKGQKKRKETKLERKSAEKKSRKKLLLASSCPKSESFELDAADHNTRWQSLDAHHTVLYFRRLTVDRDFASVIASDSANVISTYRQIHGASNRSID